jgi:hypothetical protein
VYSAKIDGEPTTFGTSGLLYRSDKLMYDRKTESLWSSLLGEPVIGPLADSEIKLAFFPVVLTTWEEWLAEQPDNTVLSIDTGIYLPSEYGPEGDPNSAYFGYRNSRDTRFAVPRRDTRLGTKQEVLGISQSESHKAYPVSALRKERVVNDLVGSLPVVIVASAGSSTVRVYARGDSSFEIGPQTRIGGAVPLSLLDSDGVEWEIREEALVNVDDPTKTLVRLAANISFWFAWFVFHPDTEVYGLP